MAIDMLFTYILSKIISMAVWIWGQTTEYFGYS